MVYIDVGKRAGGGIYVVLRNKSCGSTHNLTLEEAEDLAEEILKNLGWRRLSNTLFTKLEEE